MYLSVVATIAYRDFIKFLRDNTRLFATFIFPFIFIGVLGQSLQSNLATNVGYNFLLFTFTGVFAQVLFQSTASGIISLIEDKENDFSQEIFVSPVPRYIIIVGKILGESAVAFAQGVGIVLFGLLIGIPLTFIQILYLIPIGLVVCLFGGAFGMLVLSNLSSQRSANQIFPFVIFPQFFLSGVFSPIKDLPFYLLVLSRISPMTYAVDFVRSIFYLGAPEYSKVTLFNPFLDFAVIALLFVIFLAIGTFLFIRNEQNR